MAITKPLVTTSVLVHGQQQPIKFADAVGQGGKVTRDGTNVRYQILHGDTVCGMTANGIMEIPYHAVIMANVTVADSDPITPPEDEFCVSEGNGDGNNENEPIAPGN